MIRVCLQISVEIIIIKMQGELKGVTLQWKQVFMILYIYDNGAISTVRPVPVNYKHAT